MHESANGISGEFPQGKAESEVTAQKKESLSELRLSQSGGYNCSMRWTKWQKVDNLAQKMDILAGILRLAHNLPLLG